MKQDVNIVEFIKKHISPWIQLGEKYYLDIFFSERELDYHEEDRDMLRTLIKQQTDYELFDVDEDEDGNRLILLQIVLKDEVAQKLAEEIVDDLIDNQGDTGENYFEIVFKESDHPDFYPLISDILEKRGYREIEMFNPERYYHGRHDRFEIFYKFVKYTDNPEEDDLYESIYEETFQEQYWANKFSNCISIPNYFDEEDINKLKEYMQDYLGSKYFIWREDEGLFYIKLDS